MSSLPSLTSLDDAVAMQKHFLSAKANWVVPGKVIAGQSPLRADEGTEKFIEMLVNDRKVTTFVCLQSEASPQSPDAEVLGGVHDYGSADTSGSYADAAFRHNPASKFVYYGMQDEEVAPSVESLHGLIDNLAKKVEDGEVLYIHCKGGSGRTGLVVASLLGSLYPEMNAEEALDRTQKYFEMRTKGLGKWVNPKIKSPATDGQRQQVREFFAFVVDSVRENEETAEGESQLCSTDNCSIM